MADKEVEYRDAAAGREESGEHGCGYHPGAQEGQEAHDQPDDGSGQEYERGVEGEKRGGSGLLGVRSQRVSLAAVGSDGCSYVGEGALPHGPQPRESG